VTIDSARGARHTDIGITWLSTQDAAKRLGVTPRTLYRFIDEGQLAAYRFGRVIRLQLAEVDEFIERCRIQPGSLEHLYPESVASVGGAVGSASGGVSGSADIE
jgi:excisionase family DNA binding protein